MESSEAECVWNNVFDDTERHSLHVGFFVIGFVSAVLGLWLNSSILLSNLNLDASYRNLANFTIVACTRRILPLVAHLPFVNLGSTNGGWGSCEVFAFVETFLAVFEVEWLTHVCIERYVVAKYAVNGWPMQKYHYKLFQVLCIFFASLYSVPPLLGIGRYGLDFSCTFCTFDMILQDSWQKYAVVVIFLLRSIKPSIFMFMMLIWARIMERKLVCSEESQKQVKFTKNIITITLLNQVCWFPIALLRGGVILSQLTYSQPILGASSFYIQWAMWIHWMAPALTAITLFAVDHELRDQMLYISLNQVTEENSNNKED